MLTFFFNDTATTEIYTLSLHDALPISIFKRSHAQRFIGASLQHDFRNARDRKSTRLNSSHQIISYAVFCLKKKNKSFAPNRVYRKRKALQRGALESSRYHVYVGSAAQQ